MDLIVSPSVVTFNTQSGSPKTAMTPGQLIDALVLQLIDATTVRLAVGENVIDVKTDVPLEEGAHVRLAVRGYGDDVRWVIVGTVANTASPRASETVKPGTAAPPPHPALPATEVTIGATTPSTDADAAVSVQIKPERAQIAQQVQPPKPIEISPAVEFATATRTAAARQGGLAPVFAELNALVRAPQIPPAVRTIAEQILRTPVDFGEPSADNLRAAISKSGLFLEARLSGDGNAAMTSPFSDFKAALLTLRQTLHDWVETLPASSPLLPPSAGQTAAKAETANALTQFQSDIKAPPPPYRNAPTAGQQPVSAAPLAESAPSDIARTLLDHADGAISRQVLMQVASLPDAPSTAPSQHDGIDTHWNLEIPYVTPQGTAVAHFEIARDGHKASAREQYAPAWRANFSLDFEPVGPVHAQIALTGKRTAVRIWAERTATASALRAGVSDLANALRAAALDAGDVVVRDGAPPRPLKPNPGRFLDRAS